MAIGITPKFSGIIRNTTLSSREFLAAELIAAEELEWDILSIYENNFVASTRISWVSMTKIAGMELLALDVFSHTDHLNENQMMKKIKEYGIYYWERSLEVLNQADSLDIPPELRKKNRVNREYLLLRKKRYDLIYRPLEEKDLNKYQDSLQQIKKEVESKMNELYSLEQYN